MKKSDRPSEHFVGAILRAYDKCRREYGVIRYADDPPRIVTPSDLWTQICVECLKTSGGFLKMFEWDTSRAENINRIGTIIECLERGYVPGLTLAEDERGRKIVRGFRQEETA